MLPTIILDKSALQGFSADEILTLQNHFWLNITPILALEIFGDLSKPASKSGGEEGVKNLAQKMPQWHSKINAEWPNLAFGSLDGHDIPMNGRAVIFGGKSVMTQDGQRGVSVEQSPMEEVVFQWGLGRFSDEERELAAEYRLHVKGANLEQTRQQLRPVYKHLPRPRDYPELQSQVASYMAEPNRQLLLIRCFCERWGWNMLVWREIRKRWRSREWRGFEEFAPYACFCMKVMLTFELGLVSDLVTTRPTNVVDTDYLFYLPFCKVFASNDHQQENLAKILMFPWQDFVSGNELRADIKRIHEHRQSLNEEERKEFEYQYGPYPREEPTSVVYRLWKKHMPPRRGPAGNRLDKMTEAERAELMRKVKPIMDALRSQDKNR